MNPATPGWSDYIASPSWRGTVSIHQRRIHPMAQLLGIHWVTTTRGTWLHGDPRGSWCQGKLIGPDPFLESAIRRRRRRDAVVLSPEECDKVAETIHTVCRQHEHKVLSIVVEPTHTHVLLSPVSESITRVVARLKRQTTMVVRREREQRGCLMPEGLWSRGRFIVYIDDPRHLENTMAYIERHAGARKLRTEC